MCAWEEREIEWERESIKYCDTWMVPGLIWSHLNRTKRNAYYKLKNTKVSQVQFSDATIWNSGILLILIGFFWNISWITWFHAQTLTMIHIEQRDFSDWSLFDSQLTLAFSTHYLRVLSAIRAENNFCERQRATSRLFWWLENTLTSSSRYYYVIDWGGGDRGKEKSQYLRICL